MAHVRLQGARYRRTPGWQLHLVPITDAATGRQRDLLESKATFAHEPWARRAKYLGFTTEAHVFERPPAIGA